MPGGRLILHWAHGTSPTGASSPTVNGLRHPPSTPSGLSTMPKSEKTQPRKRRSRQPPTVIGWREWVTLPEMAPIPVKAKVDTGARTSALHAFGLRVIDGGDTQMASFELHPAQRSAADAVRIECPITALRKVRSSNGKVETRPVIRTPVTLGGQSWTIEVTLTSRDAMGFRMLLGRSALRRRFIVDPGRSFLGTSVEDQ